MRPVATAFVRRRTVWLPTLRGWLLLAAMVAALVATIAPRAYTWLAVDRPARGPDGRGARLLVVEGWLNPHELAQAITAFRAGHYERIVTTGGPSDDWPESPLPTTYAERAAAYLARHGVAADRVVAVPAPDAELDRTYASAVRVRDWLRGEGGAPVAALDVFTAGTHARRSRMLYRMAFGPTVEIGARTATPRHDPARWWRSSAAAKLVVAETLSTAWTACCFWPGSGHD